MPYFGTFRGFNNNLFGDKLFAGQKPIFLGDADNFFGFTINTNNTSAGSSTNTQFRLPLTTSQDLDFVIDWGDGVVERITSHTALEITHTYGTAGIYEIQIRGSILGWRFNGVGDRLKILNISKWSALNISTDNGFFGCANLTCSATDAPIITSLSLANYFYSCTNFNGAIGNWNVSNVTIMSFMFYLATSFNQDISSWNTQNVTNMQGMFEVATSFNQNIGSWNTGNVTNMSGMFFQATSFNQNIGSWNTGNVTNMRSTFRNATAFNQDISNWNIANVTDFTTFMLGKTFLNYSATNLDLIYNKWSLQSVKPNISISFGTIKYTASGQAGKNVLTGAPNNWTITDGGT
jgi:surface protein